MMKIFEIAANFEFILKYAARKEVKLDSLRPDDILTVYHGTSLSQLFHMINGFDANEIKPRLYGGPRHAGVFVSPSIDLADRFAPYGIVIELAVMARNLHGTDYSGNIGRSVDPHGKETSKSIIEYAKEQYPNSFRPYLTYTLLQSNEPQALLRGLIGPNQIKKIRYGKYREEPVWYSRSEFLELGLDIIPAKDAPYGQSKKFNDIGQDLSYPNYSNDELISLLSTMLEIDNEQTKNLLIRYVNRIDGKYHVADLLNRLGIGITAAKNYAENLSAEYLKQVDIPEN